VRRVSIGETSITAIGAGDICLARSAARRVDHGEVARTLHAAVAAGLDLLDAAPDAEEMVGSTVRALHVRDRAIVATRIPAIAVRPSGDPTRDTLAERLPARYVQERIERSLRATRLDAIPLAQLPLRAAWRTSSAWPELAGTAARLVREGKVLRWGAILDTIEDDTAQLADEAWLQSLSVPFSLCVRAAEPLLATRLAIVARQPLAGGALAGRLGPGMRLPPDDDRNDLDEPTLTRMAVEAARLARYVKHTPPAARSCDPAKAQLEKNPRLPHLECDTLAELALRAVIDRGAIALPRLHRPDHVPLALLAVASPPLPPDLLAELFPPQIS
jgi:aryl-alcohol dehydrogenase-like predicted oxidoreductase